MIYLQHRELLEKIGIEVEYHLWKPALESEWVKSKDRHVVRLFGDDKIVNVSEKTMLATIRGAIATWLDEEHQISVARYDDDRHYYEIFGADYESPLHNGTYKTIDEANIAALQALTTKGTE